MAQCRERPDEAIATLVPDRQFTQRSRFSPASAPRTPCLRSQYTSIEVLVAPTKMAVTGFLIYFISIVAPQFTLRASAGHLPGHPLQIHISLVEG
jgi:hypothetical protein